MLWTGRSCRRRQCWLWRNRNVPQVPQVHQSCVRTELSAVNGHSLRFKYRATPGVEPEKIAKWELRHQEAATVDPRAEFAEVLRSIGGIVEGEHPIMDGKGHRLRTEKDKRGEAAIFYRAYLDGVANGYAENNRTKEVRRWKARGQHLSEEQRNELLAEAEKKRFERGQAEEARFEATAMRLSTELRTLSFSGVEKTGYHEAKGIDPLAGAPVRNGDLLVPGYDVDGKLWTIQYIKEDGTKRFAKESRKHGCFHVVGAANGATALQKIAVSPVVIIAEGYATAGDDCETRESADTSRIRLRQPPFGRHGAASALPGQSDHHRRR